MKKMKNLLLAALLGTGLATTHVVAQAQSSAPAGARPAYFVAEFQPTDPEGMKPYSAQVEGTIKSFGGRYIVRQAAPDNKEGFGALGRIAVTKFDSLAQAKAWYESPAYQALLPIRQRSGNSRTYFVEGLSEPAPAAPAASTLKPAYYFAEFQLTDPEGIKPYSAQVESTFKPFSGRYVVRGGELDVREGFGAQGRLITIKFDSLAQAQAWYSSPEYQSIISLRHRSGNTRAYIVDGVVEQ